MGQQCCAAEEGGGVVQAGEVTCSEYVVDEATTTTVVQPPGLDWDEVEEALNHFNEKVESVVDEAARFPFKRVPFEQVADAMLKPYALPRGILSRGMPKDFETKNAFTNRLKQISESFQLHVDDKDLVDLANVVDIDEDGQIGFGDASIAVQALFKSLPLTTSKYQFQFLAPGLGVDLDKQGLTQLLLPRISLLHKSLKNEAPSPLSIATDLAEQVFSLMCLENGQLLTPETYERFKWQHSLDHVTTCLLMQDGYMPDVKGRLEARLDQIRHYSTRTALAKIDYKEGVEYFLKETKPGTLINSKDTFKKMCNSLSEGKGLKSIEDPVLDGLFNTLDADGTGQLKLGEWLAAMACVFAVIDQEEVDEVIFKVLDKTGQGVLTKDDLAEYLRPLAMTFAMKFDGDDRTEVVSETVDLVVANMTKGGEVGVTNQEWHEWLRDNSLFHLMGGSAARKTLRRTQNNSIRVSQLQLNKYDMKATD